MFCALEPISNGHERRRRNSLRWGLREAQTQQTPSGKRRHEEQLHAPFGGVVLEMDGGGRAPRGDAPLDAVPVRLGTPLLHGRRVHAPHGAALLAALRPRLPRHAPPPRAPPVLAAPQHPLRRSQHGVCGDANQLYLMDVAHWRTPQSHHFNIVHVHLPWHFGLLHPASIASGVFGVWCGLSCWECFVFFVFLGACCGFGDCFVGHEEDAEVGTGMDFWCAQCFASCQVARFQRPLHYWFGCRGWCWNSFWFFSWQVWR